jgi:hypothetical protein
MAVLALRKSLAGTSEDPEGMRHVSLLASS